MHQRLRRCQFCDHTFTGRKRKFCYDCLPNFGDYASRKAYNKNYMNLLRGVDGVADCGPAFSSIPKGHPAWIKPKPKPKPKPGKAHGPPRPCADCDRPLEYIETSKDVCERCHARREAALLHGDDQWWDKRQCDGCGTQYEPLARNQTYCSRRCKRLVARNDPAGRMAMLRTSGKRDRYTLRQIAERDGWRCQLCGKKINETKRWPHKQSATIDHILPISKGGLDVLANIQLAHFECNASKGNRVWGDGEQLRLTG